MRQAIGKSARQYLVERCQRDPEFVAALDEARREADLAVDLHRHPESRGLIGADLDEADVECVCACDRPRG